MVTTENMENALTPDYQAMEWESYFIEFIDDEGDILDNVIYAGTTGPAGAKMVYIIDKDSGEVNKFKLDELECNIQFFIGNENTGAANPITAHYANGWYIEIDPDTKKKSRKRKRIADFDHNELEGKGCYFIVKK